MMKRQRYRIKLIAILLFLCFLGLAVWGVWSVTHYGSRWFSHVSNARLNAQKREVIEGDVLDRNGLALAVTDEDGHRVFRESVADRSALVHILGDRQGQIANTVESLQAGYLYGYRSSLLDAVDHLIRRTARKGNTVTLSLDADLCTEASAAYARHAVTSGRSGAAVILNYRTGEVLALISLPAFDPDLVSAEDIAVLDHPYWNRALQALYPPGSTFKMVTAVAALTQNPEIIQRTFSCDGSLPISDTYVVRDFGSASHGTLDLRTAFMRSCNVVFASCALELGQEQMRLAAERFGFNQNFLFRDLVAANSLYPRDAQDPAALAASGFGQSSVALTPMHLCLITSAIANNGQMMEPRLVRTVHSATGASLLSWSSFTLSTVCDSESAQILQSYMKDTVQGGGSGTAAAVTTLDVRGKTGTAESSVQGTKVNYGWFTGYNAQTDLPFAVTVLVEDIPEGETGGTTAALIAKDLFTYLKAHPDRVQ